MWKALQGEPVTLPLQVLWVYLLELVLNSCWRTRYKQNQEYKPQQTFQLCSHMLCQNWQIMGSRLWKMWYKARDLFHLLVKTKPEQEMQSGAIMLLGQNPTIRIRHPGAGIHGRWLNSWLTAFCLTTK